MARIAGVDLPRNKRIEIALTYIYGLGRHAANVVLRDAGISPDKRSDDLDENDVRKIRDAIEANFRVKREVMNVGHVRSEDVVRVRSSHMWIGSLGRYRRSSPVGTIASVENYKRYYSPAVMPGSLPPGQSPLASIRGNSIAAGRR